MHSSSYLQNDFDHEKVHILRSELSESARYIHFNNAGDSPMPKLVLDKVKSTLDQEHLYGGYHTQDMHSEELQHAYVNIGRMIGASNPQAEIALVDSATTAWTRAFYTIPLVAGDIILTSHIEYAANYVAMLQRCKTAGAVIHVVPKNEYGQLSITALEESIQRFQGRVKCVSITWIPTNGGVIIDAAAIGEVCSRYADIIYILDACQAVGHIAIDVQQLKCDVLSATGRKYLRAPRGTGFLYVNEKALKKLNEPVTIDHYAAPWVALDSYAVAATAKRFEQWERNVAGILGLNVAVEYYLDVVGILWAEQRIRRLGNILRERLAEVDRKLWIYPHAGDYFPRDSQGNQASLVREQPEHVLTVHDLGDVQTRCGIVSFSVKNISAESIKAAMTEDDIFVSISTPQSTLYDASDRMLPNLLRASVHYFNTEAEIDRFCTILEEICNRYDKHPQP